jgi:hypothetical protein
MWMVALYGLGNGHVDVAAVAHWDACAPVFVA